MHDALFLRNARNAEIARDIRITIGVFTLAAFAKNRIFGVELMDKRLTTGLCYRCTRLARKYGDTKIRPECEDNDKYCEKDSFLHTDTVTHLHQISSNGRLPKEIQRRRDST